MKLICGGLWALGVALVLASSGCMSAEQMAIRANATELNPGEVKGFIVSPSNPRVPTAIVVSYVPEGAGATADDPVMLIPADAAGKPLVGRERVAPIPTEADFEKGSAAFHSKYFSEDDPRHPDVRWVTSQIGGGLVGCRIQLKPFRGFKPAGINEPDLVLFMPSGVPRPQHDIDADRVRVALLWAPTEVMEIAFMPIGGMIWSMEMSPNQ
jgi:hypothetical protein